MIVRMSGFGSMPAYIYMMCPPCFRGDQSLHASASPFGKLSLKTCCTFHGETVCFTITLGIIWKRYLKIMHASKDTLGTGMNTRCVSVSRDSFRIVAEL